VGDGKQQALDYATTLDVPFVFSSNGDSFVFHDRIGVSTPLETTLSFDRFPSPAMLWEQDRAWKGLLPEQEKLILQPYYDDSSCKGLATTSATPSTRPLRPLPRGRIVSYW
jgi:type I restriction enzyme R subunit